MSLGLYEKLLRRKICKSGWQESWQEASKSSWQQDKKPPPPSCQGDAKKTRLTMPRPFCWHGVVQKRRNAVPLVVGAHFFLSKIHGHFLELRGGSEEAWGRILERMPHLLSWHLTLATLEPSGDTKKRQEHRQRIKWCAKVGAPSVSGVKVKSQVGGCQCRRCNL